MAEKYWWQKTEKQDAENRQEQSRWWLAGSAEKAAQNVTNRVNTWLKNHNTYISNYQKRNAGRKYTSDDSYVGDSADWLKTVSQQKSNFDAEADSILSYMDQYNGYFDEKWVNSVKNTLATARKDQSIILENSTKDNEFWTQFQSEDMVKQYGSAEEAYKTSQRYDGYSKKYTGQKIEDIQKALNALEAGEEKDWLTYNQHNLYKGDSTYNSKATSGWKSYEAQMIAAQEAEGAKPWWQKAIESFATAPGDTSLPTAGISNAQAAYRNDTSYRHPNDKWSQDQKNHFGYLYSTNQSEAYIYAEQLNNLINATEKYEQQQAAGAWASQNLGTGILGTLGAIATAPFGLADLLDDMVEYSARGTITNKGGMTPFEYSQAVQSGVASKLNGVDENGVAQNALPDWVPIVGGKGWGDVYSLGVSTANSLMSAYTLGGTGTLINFIGQGGASGVDDALSRGATPEQALLYGTIVGAAEGVTEMISIDKLLKIGSASTIKNFLMNSLKQGLGETVEEGASALIGNVADNIIMADKSNFNTMVKEIMESDPNITEEEAKKKAWGKLVEGVAYDAIGGFISGFASGNIQGGISTAIDSSKKNQKNIDALKKYGDRTDALIQEGLESDIKSDSYKLATKYQQQVQGKDGKQGNALTGNQIRNLLAANQEQITPKDMKKIQQAAEKRLTSLGQTEDVAKVAELATKYATGQKLTRSEKSLLAHSAYGSRVANELLPTNILSGDYSTEWAEDIGTKNVNKVAYNKKQIQSILEAMANAEDPASYKSLESRMEAETPAKVSDTGKAVIRGTDKEVDLTAPTFKQISDDGVVLDVNGEPVNANKIEYDSEEQGLTINAIGKIEHITPAAASALYAKLDMKKSVMKQLNGMDEAFTYGYYNYSEADLKAGLFTGNLTKEQLNDAYKLGQYVRGQDDVSEDAPRIKMRTEADAKLTAEQKTAKQKAQIESEDAEVYFQDGNKVVKFDEHTGKYDDKRMAAVNTAKFLSKLVIGSKYIFFESYVNKDGERVYKDADGNEVEAPNGMYEADGTIWIDLNAGDAGQGTALFTLGHELTHFVKAQSKKQFKVLGDLVAEAFDKTDLSMRERVIAKQKFLENKRGNAVSYDEAYEEVVADAMSTMLSDGSFHEKIMEIKVKDKGLFNTIKRFFEKMIAKFRKAYEELTPDQKDAQDIHAMKDMFDKIQTAFAESLVEASDNFQAAEGQKNTAKDGGGIKYMSRDVDSVTEDTVRSDLTDVFNGNNVAAASYIPLAKTTPFAVRYITGYMEDRPIIVDKKKAYFDMREDGKFKEDSSHHYHGMGIDGFLDALVILNDPEFAILEDMGNGKHHYAFISSNENGEEICVVFQMNVTKNVGQMNGYPGGYYNLDITEFVATDEWLEEHGVETGTSYKDYLLSFPENSIAYDRSIHFEQLEKARLIDSESAGLAASYDNNRASSDKVTQPDTIVKNESVEAMDVEVDAKTESVAPAVLKSERTWASSDYVQERNKAAKEIAKAIGVSEKKAMDYIDSVNSIAKMIAEDRSRLDYFSSPDRTSFIGNVEYGGSFDFSTLCKKRRLLTGTFTAIQKALPNTALTADEILDIRNRMKKANLEVSCGLCYVEGSRANMGQFAKEFLRLYKQYYPDAWQPNMADVNTPDGIEWVRINHPECYEQYEYFWNHYGTLKDVDKNLFASQQKPKLYQLHTEYKSEILDKFKDDDNVEEKNLNGGIRLQSFSDFEIVHLIDTMQIIMDMSRVGLAGQAYTKVPDFAWALGDTGLKINLSLIAKGVDADGKLVFDDVEGMPIAEAMKLRDRYSKNVGTILVAFNDEQLLAAMADDRVDYIIPFHRSQWKKSQYEAMGLPAKTKDYTYMQNEKYIKPQFHEYRGRMVKDKATNYMPNEYWDFSKSGKENAEAYLEMCARNNKRPKFYKFLQNNGDGSYSLKDDGSTDGYWKLLIDFKMYDNDGNGSPQLAVKPEFNMEEANRMLDDYKGGHSNFPVAQGIVDGFLKDYKASHKGQKLSDRDSTGKQLTKEQQEFFKDSKVRDKKGNLLVIYHGTTANFNTFKKGDVGFHFGTKGAARGRVGYGKNVIIKEVYLNIANPIVFDEDLGSWDADYRLTRELYDRGILTHDEAISVLRTDDGRYKRSTESANKKLASVLIAKGYDGIAYQNTFETKKATTSYIAFASNQAKEITNANPTSNSDIRYSERGEGASNRHLLANAFEGITKSSPEYKLIQEYKGRIKLLNEQEEKLSKLNAEIHKIRFGTTGQRDTERLAQLEAEAKNTAQAINRHDKKLLSLEASEPLRKVIERERKKEARKTKDHVKEIQQNKKVRAEQTELRHKIRKTIRDLDKILNRGNKKQNVKEDMKSFASKALELADYLFTDHISNDDLIRKGITVRMTEKEAALVKETEDILSKLYDHADSLTDEEFTRLDAKRKANEDKLRDLLKAQRNERLNTPVYNLFNDLVTEYASLKNSKQDSVKAAYDEVLENSLRAFMGDEDRVKILKNMRVADMTTEELNWVYRAYTMVLTNVRNANKFHVNGITETIEQRVGRIAGDFSSRKIPDKKAAIIARNLANKIGWDYEKLYYALDRIGSEAFTDLVMNIANSENTVMQDVMEAAAFRDKMVKEYGFNNWDVNKEIDREFLDNTGKKFKLTLGQLMALYAYSRREGAWDHIEYGGFVFGEAALTNPRPADSYKLSKEQCEAITSLLTEKQRGYAEAMQKYLSETMGEKGNEVSMMLYGIKMFGEKNYFPIHIAGQFKAQANESQAKAAAGFSSMSNAGFTHAQNPNAKAPFVLEGFDEIWVDHVNEMSRYHGTVPALEDMRRVMNRSSYSESGMESMAIKQLMENSYGKEAVEYFDNLYREANSGAITDKLQKNSKKLLSLFRKNSVAYSLSVMIQQPAAMVRAYDLIDRKYFGFNGFGTLTSGIAKAVSDKWTKAHTNAYNEMLKYAPGVTMAKEIGGFDTATGGSIRSYLLDTNKSLSQKWKTGTAIEKGSAVMDLVDNNAIANLPNLADKIAWIEIWNACKRETVATHKNLSPNSEEFMQAVGERFTEVIRATQVYDSIFAKSPMLKSKNLAVQYLVSFMNEPNTVANMVEKAVRDATKGDWKSGAKTAAVVVHSIIFTNVLKSIIYAMRDDDDDETYIEKYIEAVTGNMMSDLNPLSYIPIARDVVSLAQGYDVERADMTIVADALDALDRVIKNGFTETEDMTEEQLVEFDKKCTEANWKLVESIAAFFGIPVKNIRREIEGVINTAKNTAANNGQTTLLSAWEKVYDAVIESIPFMQVKNTKRDKLYEAIMAGDQAYLGRLKSTYKDDSAYQSAVRKALRENDPRIHEAAQAKYEGRTEDYKRIFREIQKEGKFAFDDIMGAVNSDESAIRNKLEPDKATSSYSASSFVEAVIVGNMDSAQVMMEDLISTYVANGKTQAEAEKQFATNVSSSVHDAFSGGLLDEARAEEMLQEYAGKDEEEAASKVSYWAFCDKHPEYDLSESNVTDYLELAEPVNISLDVYAQFVSSTKGLSDIKDEWGDVEVTKREQVLEVIDSLPLTWEQKDALYLAAGYSESKIWDVPW